ncbi:MULTISPECIES: NYN domain-containing protein [unclassified Ruegeria]|uniref:NYN domain-containing protein n=1 Tax=unclassified Ruegeria TaxID=2625375 RepID=UPI001489669F|nr:MULTISPECIES: NYN domain-containing protein [unclassified Ruegeria]NOD63958.1 NYN domain-containing protein [Ruegeria sp. HKCCD6109]
MDRLAVLIDVENVPAKHAPEIFEEIATLGEASLRRIYGDFSNGSPQGWNSGSLAEYAIVPQQQFANTSGKNSSDIALVIDAMDILHSGRFGGFVLVSSDSDFTRLASRVREQGLDVFGIGEIKAPKAFVAACNRFIYLEYIEAGASNGKQSDSQVPKRELNHAFQLIRNVMRNSDEPEGWLKLGFVGSQLNKIYTDFDPRSYGFSKLSDLVRATGKFDEQGANGDYKVRLKAGK